MLKAYYLVDGSFIKDVVVTKGSADSVLNEFNNRFKYVDFKTERIIVVNVRGCQRGLEQDIMTTIIKDDIPVEAILNATEDEIMEMIESMKEDSYDGEYRLLINRY